MSVVIRVPPYEQLEDPVARECFQWIVDFLRDVPLLQGNFRHIILTINKAETGLKLPHNLGFKPEDIIQTSLTGAGTITYNYSSFDNTNLNITTTGACVVRLFAGRYEREFT